MGKAVGVLWDLHIASWCPCMPGESRVAWSGCCACDSDPEHEPGERAAVPWHEPAAGNERLLVPQPHKGGGGRAGLGMQQGPCAEAPALQGRGTAVPAVAAARARAIGGGPRTGTCWIYGPSHDVFMAGMGQPQMLPSPALPGTARHGTSGPRSASWCRQGGGFQMDFALRGGAPRGSPWHRCRVCPLPGSSTAPSLPAPQAGTWCGGRNLSVLSRPVLSGPGAALVLSPSRLPPQSRYADPLPLPHIQGWSWAGVCSHSSPVPSAGSREA